MTVPSVSVTSFLQTHEPDEPTFFPVLTGSGFTQHNTVSVVSLFHLADRPDTTVTETFATDGVGNFQNRVARAMPNPNWEGLQEITVDVTDLGTGVTVSFGPLAQDSAPRAPDYTVIATLSVYEPGWVAVSPDGTRIYVSRGYGTGTDNGISVIDEATYALTPVQIPNVRNGGSPFSLTADGSRLYVSTQFSITVVDTANYAMTVISMEDDPWYSAISPDGTRLYVCTDDDGLHRVEVLDIDPASPTHHTVIDSFDYSGTAISPGSGGIAASSRFIYLASDDLTHIDLTTRLVESWGDIVGENQGVVVVPVPGSTGIDRVYLALANSNQVAVFDEVLTTGGTMTVAYQETIDLGVNPNVHPLMMAASHRSRVYVIKGDQSNQNTVSVIAPAETFTSVHYVHFGNQVFEEEESETFPIRMIATIPVRKWAIGAAVSPDGYSVYLSSSPDALSVIAVPTP